MGVAPFFDRVYGAVGGHLAMSRDSLTAVLEDTRVGIVAPSSPSQNEIWIAELSANMLGRLYSKIAVRGPDKLTTALKALISSINPNIEFCDDSPDRYTIAIGTDSGQGSMSPCADGWVAHLARTGSQHQGVANPYSAAAAAAFACSELFRRVFTKTSIDKDISVSLLDFSAQAGQGVLLSRRRVGRVAFVGVGAVGNAAVWCLSRDVELRGDLRLIDPELLTLLNLQRYVLGTMKDVGRSKVRLAAEILGSSGLTVTSFETSLEAYADAHNGLDAETVCVSVDNVATRRAAQALLPRLAINGWTGDRALGSSWHRFTNNAACLSCLYHPHGQGSSMISQAAHALGLEEGRAALLWVTRQPLSDEDLSVAAKALGVADAILEPWRGKPLGDLYTDVVCGAVAIDIKAIGRVESVPLAHQSVLAGVLMAAELVKRTDEELASKSQSEPLVSWDDILRAPPHMWTKPRARERGCICGDEIYQQVFRRRWNNTASA